MTLGMDNKELTAFTRLLVSDLVTNGAITTQSGGNWGLTANVAGLGKAITFRNEDELIDRVTTAYVNLFSQRAGIRSVA